MRRSLARLLLLLPVLLAAAGCAHAPALAARPLRVVTWNIHHGRGLDDVVDVARLADELAALRPDVVFLQEVDVGVRRSGRANIPDELGARLGMHAAFGKNLDYQGGDYGNAILSRLPLYDVRNLHYQMLRAGEQRGVLQARVEREGRALWLWSTHIDWRPDDAERRANVAELRALLGELGAPVVLAGDFNDLPGSAVHATICEDFVDAHAAVGDGDGATYPAAAPQKRIDWVLCGGPDAPRPLAARVVPTAASDHRPVLVEVATRR